MTDEEPPPEELPAQPTRLEVLPETEPTPGETSGGMIWVPTARGLFGELTDWQLVSQEVAAQYDVRLWRRL